MTAEIGAQHAPFVSSKLRRAAKLVPRNALRELSIVLVNDRRMSALHKQFMNDSSPTDVLTFPIDTDNAGRVTSGEVYVNVPWARREVKTRDVEAKHEVLLYALHGMLHLLGYDDRNRRAFRTMHRTEDDLLTQLGIGPVFARSSRGGKR